jgi:hypothetical protein
MPGVSVVRDRDVISLLISSSGGVIYSSLELAQGGRLMTTLSKELGQTLDPAQDAEGVLPSGWLAAVVNVGFSR